MNLWEEYGLTPDTSSPPMTVDYRHAEMLYHVILAAAPKVAVEIGSHMGHSTVAFLKAKTLLPDMQIHVFEPSPTESLERIVGDAGTIHATSVWSSDLSPDFVFIDGDHGYPALADLAFCLVKQVPVIAMHDTRSHSIGIPGCWGAEAVADLLRKAETRVWFSDEEDRPNEWTKRGFGVSVIRGMEEPFKKLFLP